RCYLQPWLSISGAQPVITCRHPVIGKYFQRGRELYVNHTVLSLSAPAHCFVWLCIAQSVESTDTAHNVKQHTVNPLIASDVNPFLPSAISTVSVL
ncbi:unnamed protein product, partial [Staurois parvus]